MPRDGSGTYTLPFPPVVTNTTISSAVENGTDADIAQDLNTPRPIVAGGTGASSAATALFNVSGEKAAQVVTNWDSTTWLPGSFYAATSATGTAPVAAHAFAGICYLNEPLANPPTNQNLVTEVTDLTDSANTQYLRVMTAGVWSPWTKIGSTSAAGTLGEYTFDTGTSFPPASGTIRFNNATQNSTTELFISHLTATGVDVTSSIPLFKAGNDISIQDKAIPASYKIFTATAGPVMSGGDCRILVTAKIAGTDIAAAKRVAVSAPGGPAVRYDAPQGLTDPQQVQGRQNIYAAPFDAMAYNGMQINGAADISQENGTTQMYGGAGGTVVNKYIADGWVVSSNGAQSISYSQSNSGVATFPPGYSNYVAVWLNVNNAAPAAGDYCSFQQYTEGYRVSRLAWGTANASPITFCFWAYAVRPGNYSGVVNNGAFDRSYAFTFTITTGSVWEFKTVTVPGDTTGTWTKVNGIGLTIRFAVMAGTTYQTAAGVWTAGSKIGATGTINGIAAASDLFAITGLVVLPGLEAPSAARSPLIMRPYDQELLMCQRYYFNRAWGFSGYAVAAAYAIVWPFHPVIMRAAPSVATAGGTLANVTAPLFIDFPTIHSVRIYAKATVTGTAQVDSISLIGDARL